ncbi:hypothetical protein SISNIDRAFT_509706 [Sistotremastrum niveocremeum HHB9708]|uniref:DUF6535 domain-containing protein n=1 Tax=Sistotremastrum niveocremeum HHB9708 TaxID=1314777 RepID=A0A164TW87_9AGAM|nr:hypothetical protein SISNIDRAFT_509706 [Sistotremastrum niveocremeum HHB9708]
MPYIAESNKEPDPGFAEAPSISKFDKLLFLMENQNTLIESLGNTLQNHSQILQGQHATMEKHTSMLEALEKDATKEIDDRPHDTRPLEDEQTWGALDKESLAKIRVVVEGWRDLMQISLVFIALFLTVVTAFISPLIQAFTSPPADAEPSSSSKDPLPSAALQFVALFYYLALVFSIFNSILCVLGMQWAGRLIAVPLGKTNLERTLARERRKAIADRYMLPLMGVLFWTLLLAIGFFVVGLLIQFWELAFSFQGPAAILAFGAVVATVLSLIILGIIVATTVHATLHQNSPFESPLSNALLPLLMRIRRFRGLAGSYIQKEGEKDTRLTDWEDDDDDDDDDDDSTGHKRGADDVLSSIQWQDGDSTEIQTLKAYARLVINTNDTEFLERVVPSFDFGKWYAGGDSLFAPFMAVRDRFLASDTSFRLKETLHSQVANLNYWKSRRRLGGADRGRTDNALTRWWARQCRKALTKWPERIHEFLPCWAFLLSFEEGNEMLCRNRPETYERCITNILTSYDFPYTRQGDRRRIFIFTASVCNRLATEEDPSTLTALLRNVDRSRVIVSLIRSPSLVWHENLLSLLTRGNAKHVFHKVMNKMLYDHLLPESLSRICRFLGFLVPHLSPTFNVSPVDFSPLLFLVDPSKGQKQQQLIWEHYDTLLYYLNHGAFDCLSELRSAHSLWEWCRDRYLRNSPPEDRLRHAAFYLRYAACFIPLPSLSDEECRDLCNNICSLLPINWNKRSKISAKGPILELQHLDEAQRHDVLIRVLPTMRRSQFIDLILAHSSGDGSNIKDLVLPITQDCEPDFLGEMKLFSHEGRLGFVYPNYRLTYRCLEFLDYMITSLPADFRVPRGFAMHDVIRGLVETECNRMNWRRYSDAIIFYLDHGAPYHTGAEYFERFFNLCLSDSSQMKDWSDEDYVEYWYDQGVSFSRHEPPGESSSRFARALSFLDRRSRTTLLWLFGSILRAVQGPANPDVQDIEFSIRSRGERSVSPNPIIQHSTLLKRHVYGDSEISQQVSELSANSYSFRESRDRPERAAGLNYILELQVLKFEAPDVVVVVHEEDFGERVKFELARFNPYIKAKTRLECRVRDPMKTDSPSDRRDESWRDTWSSATFWIKLDLMDVWFTRRDLRHNSLAAVSVDAERRANPDAPHDPFDTPLFHRLLGLIEKQNETIEDQKTTMKAQIETMDEQKRTLKEHGTKLDALVKDAQKGLSIDCFEDDLPYDEEERPLKSEQLWSGVYEIATAKMKEEAEEWKGLMDVSLVFIAIFLAVLTAFLVPAAQALSPPPSGTPSNSTTPAPPLPPKSDQNMCNAVLCVLGRQWVGRLLSRPDGKTHRERTMRHEARKSLAYGWIKPLVAVLYWSLLLSIGLFIAGLLYQLRNLSSSFDQTAPILETTWSLGVILAAVILGTIAATTIHAIRFDSSPFEGLVSKFVVRILQRLERRWRWMEKWRASVNWESNRDLFKTYMQLIAEANDPKLLDRVAPSFSYLAWVLWGNGSIDVLRGTYGRLMASDTSNRVRETVWAQISRFANYCQRYPREVEGTLSENDFDDFLCDHYVIPSDFPAWATIISFQENNRDLRDVGTLSVEECIAKILCTYDQNRKLGNREQIFANVVDHCNSLVRGGNEDDLTKILSHVDHLSVVRSLMRAPGTIFFSSVNFLPVLFRHCQAGILLHVNEFLKDPPSNVNDGNVSDVLDALLTPNSPLPLGADLSPIIASVTRNVYWISWARVSASLVLYLEACEVSGLSDPNVVFEFLQLCVDTRFTSTDLDPGLDTSEDTRARAQDILKTHFCPNITPLPPSRPPSRHSSPTFDRHESNHHLPSSDDPQGDDSRRQGPHRRRSASTIHIG